MKKRGYIGLLFMICWGCSGDDYYSPDLNMDLLPDRKDYYSENYGTQALAKEIYDAYTGKGNDSVYIKMVKYDEDTRSQPLLTFTEAKWPIKMRNLDNGLLEFGYRDFQTGMMPLKMTVTINIMLKQNTAQDTIWLKGIEGSVRTRATSVQPIGTLFPQSDDAELEGYFVCSTKKLYVLFDLMLPIAIKAHITGKK